MIIRPAPGSFPAAIGQGHCQAKRRCGLEVDDQLNFCGLLDWQIGWLLALENPAGVDADQTVRVDKTGTVADKAARRSQCVKLIDRRDHML